MPATGNQLTELIQIGIISMHQMGMVPQAIADIAGVARTTVTAVLNNAELVDKYTVHELTNKLKKAFPDRIFAKCNAVLANIDPDDPNISQAQKATIFGILFDKYQISTGKATQIIDYHQVVAGIVDVDAKIVELEQSLRLEAPEHVEASDPDSSVDKRFVANPASIARSKKASEIRAARKREKACHVKDEMK